MKKINLLKKLIIGSLISLSSIYNINAQVDCSTLKLTPISVEDLNCYQTGSICFNIEGSNGWPISADWELPANAGWGWPVGPEGSYSTCLYEIMDTGWYKVTVFDEAGCSVTDSAHISYNGPLISSYIVTQESSPGANDGSIDLSVSGGESPYSYLWSNGSTSQDISGLASGNYYVDIFDFNYSETYSGRPECVLRTEIFVDIEEKIVSVSPNSASTNSKIWITISGQNTNFTSSSSISLTQGTIPISIMQTTYVNSTTLKAKLNISKSQSKGYYNVNVDDLTLQNGFKVGSSSGKTSDIVNVNVSLDEEIKIYPNPANGVINIQIDNGSQLPISVEIMNVVGELISKSDITSDISTINLNEYTEGIYFLRFNFFDKNVIQKIILEK
jgi:hypothetical protein